MRKVVTPWQKTQLWQCSSVYCKMEPFMSSLVVACLAGTFLAKRPEEIFIVKTLNVWVGQGLNVAAH